MTGSLTVNNVYPEADNTRDLGSAALSFNDAWFDGTVTIATATITSASVTSFSAALLPNADNTLDLGSAGASWNDIWIDGTATIGTLSLTTLTCTGCVDATQLAATTVTAAAYGSASGVATFTVDADGRLTTAATTAIAIATSQVTSGNYVATVTAGSGIAIGTGTGTGSTPAFSLTALTADWAQSGAYNIVLSNASAGIKILESTGATYYGIFDVGDLVAADATYTFSGTSGTVVTTANQTTTITGTGTITTGTWNGTDIAVGDGGTGVSTLASKGVLYGNDAGPVALTAPGTSAQILQADGTGVPGFVTFSGDASVAVGGAVTVANDSHDHTATTISGLGTADFTSANISQWTNDSVYITSAGTATNFSGSLAGDVTGTQGSTVVGNDSHTHDAGNLTGTTLVSGVTASSLTSVGTLTALTVSGTLTLSGAAANIALGSNYLSGDGGDEGINVNSTGEVGIAVAAQVSDKLYVLATGAQTASFTSGGFFNNTSTNTTTDGISKYGLRINASGSFTGDTGASTTAYGMTVAASGADVNWAAVFTGDVSITGVLTVTGTTNAVGTITSGVWNAGAVTSSGAVTGTALVPSSSTIPATGIYLPSASTIGFATSSALRGQFVSAGNFLVNSTTIYAEGAREGMIGVGFTDGEMGLYLNNTDSATGAVFAIFGLGAGTGSAGIGSITRNAATSAVLFNTTSDQRLKTDLGLASDLSTLRALRVHDFAWKSDPAAVVDRGVFAQEALVLKPLAGRKGNDGAVVTEVWSVDYSKFVPDLIVGWQQHDARLQALEAQLAALADKDQ